MAHYQPRHRRIRPVLRFLVGIFILLALPVTGALIFRTSLIELGIKMALESQGLGPVELSVQTVTLSKFVVGPVSLADETIGSSAIEALYSWQSLRKGTIETLKVSDLRIEAAWTENGFSLGPLDRFLTGQETDGSDNSEDLERSSTTEPPRIGRVNIENAVVSLNGPDVKGAVRWSGTVDLQNLLASSGVGAIEIDARGAQFPGSDQSISVDVNVLVSASDGVFEIVPDHEIKISAPWPSALLPSGTTQDPGVSPSLSVDATLKTGAQNAAFLRVVAGEEEVRVSFDLDLDWAGPVGQGAVDFSGWVSFGQDGLPQDFLFERLSVNVGGAPSPYGTVWADVSGDGLKGPLTSAQGPVRLEARIADGHIEDFKFEQLTLAADADFRVDGLSLAFDLQSFSLLLDSGLYPDAVRFEDTLKINLASDGSAAQTVTSVFGADGSATFTFDTVLEIDTGNVSLLSKDSALYLRGRIPAMAVDGFLVSGEKDIDIGISIKNGEVSSDFVQITGLDIDAGGTLTDLEGTAGGHVRLTGAGNARLAGLPFQSQFSFSQNIIETEWFISVSSDTKLATLELIYDLTAQDGAVTTTVGPVAFGTANSDIISPLGLPFTPLAGEIAADLNMSFGPSTEAQGGTILIRDLDIETAGVRIERLNSVIALDTVWPPQTAGTQTAAIGLIQAGVPLTDIGVSFSMTSEKAITVIDVTMAFAGGQISGGPFSLNLDGRESRVSFTVSDVQLPELAALSGLNGLEADGVLSGTIPIIISSDDVVITNGVLATEAPGSIRYRRSEAMTGVSETEGGLALALQALEDFQYDTLSVSVSGSAAKELEAVLALKGSNPDLYDGYPIEFNLNLTGELANIVKGSLTGYRVPEAIKRQFMAFLSWSWKIGQVAKVYSAR